MRLSESWGKELKERVVERRVRRKDAAWKGVLATSDEEIKERCMEAHREEKKKAKRCILLSKKKVNEQFGRKMNKDVKGNRKLFWKEMCNAKGGKMESFSRIKYGNGRMAKGDDEVRKIWKEYFEDLYNIL